MLGVGTIQLKFVINLELLTWFPEPARMLVRGGARIGYRPSRRSLAAEALRPPRSIGRWGPISGERSRAPGPGFSKGRPGS
jgi:hypothetical protein